MRHPFCKTGIGCGALVLFFGVLLAGCADEKNVFESRARFEPPPSAAQGFLGYQHPEERATICGNCHGDKEAKWQETGHAKAWGSLEASGRAEGFCESCHTTGALGNPVDGAVGFAASPEERYHDVQCESCHGPGLAHVSAPAVTQPRASLAAGSDTEAGCADCHRSTHHSLVDEWNGSAHAASAQAVRGAATDPSSSCLGCHTGQGALASWGVHASYAEADAPVSEYESVVCLVCHDPHANGNEGQLRRPLDARTPQANLCMGCHTGDAQPDDVQAGRPLHDPATEILLGQAGWWPEGAEPSEPVVMAHGSSTNEKLCAACHVLEFAVTDAATGELSFQGVAHSFRAVPCVGQDGLPVGGSECDVQGRSFTACAAAGCHGSAAAARELFTIAAAEVEALVDQVEAFLDQVPAGEEDPDDGVFTVAEGARFNADLMSFPGAAIHNPSLAEQLLNASLDALASEYGLSRPAAAGAEKRGS